jgi:hypothetical protein
MLISTCNKMALAQWSTLGNHPIDIILTQKNHKNNKTPIFVRSDVLPALTTKINVFWGVTPLSSSRYIHNKLHSHIPVVIRDNFCLRLYTSNSPPVGKTIPDKVSFTIVTANTDLHCHLQLRRPFLMLLQHL